MRRMTKIRRLLSWKGKKREAEQGRTVMKRLMYGFKTVLWGHAFQYICLSEFRFMGV